MKRIFIKNKKYNKGITTVEACVIIPITFTIIMLLIWLGFLFYNKTVLSEAIAEALMAESGSTKSAEVIADTVNEHIRERIEGRMILVNEPTITTSVNYTEIKVEAEVSMTLPDSIFFGNIYEVRIWDINIVKECPRLRPCRFIRLFDRLT